MEARFVVPGEPTGKGRPRFSSVGKYVKAYTPQKTVMYENLIKIEYQEQCRGIFFEREKPVSMTIDAYLSIPQSASKKKKQQMLSGELRPLKKADSSNILKAVEDALNQVAYHDDVQVVETHISRFYGDQPRIEVTLKEIVYEED